MKSNLAESGLVPFPTFTGERVYMLPFFQSAGLPAHLARWQPTVDAMLRGIKSDREIFLMIDQARVAAGQTHRRGGIHIDGYWVAGKWAHSPTTHRPRAASWQTATFSEPEAIILASDVSACRAFVGEWSGNPNEGGDCAHLDTSRMVEVRMQATRAYVGNVTMLHESIPVKHDCMRTVVRLNVPGI